MSSTSTTQPAAPAAARRDKYSYLAEFTLALTQAMLRTGYYSSAHPEAEKSLGGLYAQFKRTITDRDELTYLIAQTHESRDIAIEGIEPVPLSLQQAMMKGMADLFAPKLLGFFDRWGLLSFSLKADCTQEEFNAFIALMSQPPTGSFGTNEPGERLKHDFAERTIIHISTVFKQDIIGRDRRLPWRVEMALSRLRKDLSMLPLYKRAGPEQLQRSKLQIIDDVIRPMRTPALLKDFLVHCDLVAENITVLEETQVEREIIDSLSEDMMMTTGREIVRDLERNEKELEKASEGELPVEFSRRLSVLKTIAERLWRTGRPLDRGLIATLIRRNVISLEDLPEDVRTAIQTQRLAEAFLKRKDEFIEGLRRLPQGSAGEELATLIERVFPEVLGRSEYATVDQILSALDDARKSFGMRPTIDALEARLTRSMAEERTIKHLVLDLQRIDREGREHLVEIFARIGQPCVEDLRQVYAGCEAKAVRMSAFEAMRKIGPTALKPFMERLHKLEKGWDVIHHIINELGEDGDASLAEPIGRFSDHENAHVRHAALTALCKLRGAAAEDLYLKGLRDENAAVRQAAVACLNEVGSRHPRALDFYSRVLTGEADSDEPERDAVLVEVCRGLGRFESDGPEGAARAEKILLTAISPPKGKGLLARVKKPSLRHSERVMAALCDALAAVGSSDAIFPLRKLEANQGDQLGERAAAAADAIMQRSG